MTIEDKKVLGKLWKMIDVNTQDKKKDDELYNQYLQEI